MSPTPQSDEQAIRAVIAQWLAASTAGDYAALEPLMAPDVVFLTAGNEPFGREQFREGFTHIVSTMRLEGTSDVREIEILGDVAYVWSYVSVRLVPVSGDVHAERKGHVMSLYRRDPSAGWVLWRDANLMLR
ncbi:MAG TPA: SgcJ/EcaC family oxidoreductase [Acidobacteriaceae bacterium]|jgi:uncharacterized protein (TIGR02246 family)